MDNDVFFYEAADDMQILLGNKGFKYQIKLLEIFRRYDQNFTYLPNLIEFGTAHYEDQEFEYVLLKVRGRITLE